LFGTTSFPKLLPRTTRVDYRYARFICEEKKTYNNINSGVVIRLGFTFYNFFCTRRRLVYNIMLIYVVIIKLLLFVIFSHSACGIKSRCTRRDSKGMDVRRAYILYSSIMLYIKINTIATICEISV